MLTRRQNIRVMSHEVGDFSSMSGHNILIYLPHGFGDWIHFSHVLPYLNRSNNYWMTRFSDDTVALMDGSGYCKPFYLGVKSANCDNGGTFENRHFHIDYHEIDGGAMDIQVPIPLSDAIMKREIDTILFTSFPETWGESAFPYHTKARNLLRYLTPTGDVSLNVLSRKLISGINLSVDQFVVQLVDARLRTYCGYGERRLCLVGRNGYTSVSKNWGHEWRTKSDGSVFPEGEEARDFMRLMLKKDPNWLFLSIEDILFEHDHTLKSEELHCYSYAEVFGDTECSVLPFGLLMKALVNLADLSVGVPAGPHHLCMLRDDLPSVGVWISHCPSWYDEPKDASIHVLSRNLKDHGLDTRPGTITERCELRYRTMELDTLRVSGQAVLDAVEVLI